MSTFKTRLDTELKTGIVGIVSEEFMRTELKNAKLKFTTRGERKRVCKILIDDRVVAESDYTISVEELRTESDDYGHELASYNATRVLEDYIKQIAGKPIEIDFVASK